MLHNIGMRFLIFFLVSLFFLSACGPTKQVDPDKQASLEENANTLMMTGDYAGAAVEYLSLAEIDKNNRTNYRLKATAAYIEAGLYNEANFVLAETTPAEGDALQNLQKQIMSARLSLEFGQPENAHSSLLQLSESEIPQGLKVTYHDILARTYLAQTDYINAASERLRIQDFLSTPAETDQHYQLLWDIFEAIPDADLNELHFTAPENLTSWFELASIYREYQYQPGKLKNAIDGWIQHNPGHPAYSSIVPQLIDTSSQYVQRPSKIGLLLPFSGQYKKSSVAIRDGFLAAWYLDNNDKPEIQIYDTSSLDIVEKYQQAINDGADYIVGPLEKEAVNRLVEYGELPVHVLALNRQDTNSELLDNSKLIQFGLSPEDEAAQVAETAMSDGHTLALVIAPEIPWGQRIADAFTNRWVELGGAVLEQVNFTPGKEDLSESVKALLNIDSSEQRARDLRSKLNRKINTVERRRQDADFIFTVAVSSDARQLFPQFRFHRAGELPVYATSHIYTGVVDTARDTDMEGVLFLDMPWLLDTTRELSIIQDALNRNWSQQKSNYRRLYALGIDSYRLIPEITKLKSDKNIYLSGETGDLRINAENIVERKLRRGQFFEGKPVLLN